MPQMFERGIVALVAGDLPIDRTRYGAGTYPVYSNSGIFFNAVLVAPGRIAFGVKRSNCRMGMATRCLARPRNVPTSIIVEVGGFLGMGKRRVAIPVRQFTQIAPTAILPGSSKETLKKLPVFVYSQ